MATLTANVQRFGVNFLATPFNCIGSVFDVTGTTVLIREANGTLRSWRSGRSAALNNLPGTGKDQIPAYTAFQVLPTAAITTNDAVLSVGTAIPTGSGNATPNAFSSGFGA